MAKMPSDSIMPTEKLKPLLASSKIEPVQAAIGLTKEGDGLILLNKKGKGRKLMSTLRAEAGKNKMQLNSATLRFGRAVVDTEYDPGMVRFFINKEAPGNMRVKLIEVVKKAGFQKVEFNVDPALDEEPEEDEAESAEGEAEAAPADPQQAAFEARWTAFEPRLLGALQVQHPESSKLRAVSAFASEKAGAGDYGAGLKAIEAMAKLIGDSEAGVDATDTEAEREDPAHAFNARFARLVPQIQQAVADGLPEAATLRQQAAGAGAAGKAKEFDRGNDMLDEIESTLETVAGSAKAKLAAWQAARLEAVESIQDVIEAVRETGDPDANTVEIVLASIVKNLTPEPKTAAQYDELLRYVETDDVITAAEEVPPQYGALDLRAPLGAALTGAY